LKIGTQYDLNLERNTVALERKLMLTLMFVYLGWATKSGPQCQRRGQRQKQMKRHMQRLLRLNFENCILIPYEARFHGLDNSPPSKMDRPDSLYYIVEHWCTKSSTNKWPKRHQARDFYARAHFYFGQIRFATKVHRTNKDRTNI